MYVIETTDLTKAYFPKSAVKNLNLKIARSAFFGFVGPNGAGKSTTVNMLTGIIPPTSGSIKIFGLDFEKHGLEIKRRLGVVTENLALFDHLKAEEQLYFVARVYGLDKATLQSRMDELFDVFGLAGERMKFVHEYSKGMKKKLALMCAIIHEPEILFLDEPLEGIDPVSTNTIKETLKLMVQNGATVFLTSHNLELVEKLCTEVAIIHQGEVILQSSTEEIRTRIKDQLTDERYSGLEELFLDVIASPQNNKHLSWLKKAVPDKQQKGTE